MKHVALVIPVYNEEGNLALLAKTIRSVFEHLAYTYNLILVNDGSKDKSLQVIRQMAAEDPTIKYISFSRNFGKDSALKAGLDICDADVAITLDADLQHPPELIVKMLERWEEGCDVVYAYREEKNRNAGVLHQLYSFLFYEIMNHLSELKLEQGISDFRLLDKKVIKVIKELSENEVFLRGLIKWYGFNQQGIEYTPLKRATGKTAYSKRKLIRLALQGITSFSTRPLYVAAYLGFIISLCSILYLPYALYSYYFGYAISGWTSVIVTIAFFGGLQLCILGIIGLYLGKVFMQTKHRPLYIVQESNYEKVA